MLHEKGKIARLFNMNSIPVFEAAVGMQSDYRVLILSYFNLNKNFKVQRAITH